MTAEQVWLYIWKQHNYISGKKAFFSPNKINILYLCSRQLVALNWTFLQMFWLYTLNNKFNSFLHADNLMLTLTMSNFLFSRMHSTLFNNYPIISIDYDIWYVLAKMFSKSSTVELLYVGKRKDLFLCIHVRLLMPLQTYKFTASFKILNIKKYPISGA